MAKKKEVYASLSVRPGTAKKLRAMQESFQPNMTFMGFMEDVAEFYLMCRCPECAQIIAKIDKHHKC